MRYILRYILTMISENERYIKIKYEIYIKIYFNYDF